MSDVDPLEPAVDPLAPAPDPTLDAGTRRRSELELRIISAAVLAAAVVILAYFGGWPYRLMTVLVGMIILQEWSSMTGSLRPFRLAQGITVVGFAVIALLVLLAQYMAAIVATVVAFAFAYAASFWRLRETPRPPDARHWSWLSLGFLYASAFMIAFAALRGDTAFGLAACAFLLATVWATDTFAYFVGKSLGGPKLAPRISPNKTWSGFVGGVVFAVLAGWGVVAIYAAIGTLPGVGFWFVPVAMVLSVVSQCGDLFESWVKRRSGAKDSGRLIPGHGGLMDRIDGLGAAAVAAVILLVLATGGADTDDALFLTLR